MKEVFEKIVEILENKAHEAEKDMQLSDSYADAQAFEGKQEGYENAIEIVKQEAEKYNNGWIPCSERLPEDDSICIVTVEYPNNKTMVDYGWFDRKSCCWFVGTQEFRTSNILAWKPLPSPYQQKGE